MATQLYFRLGVNLGGNSHWPAIIGLDSSLFDSPIAPGAANITKPGLFAELSTAISTSTPGATLQVTSVAGPTAGIYPISSAIRIFYSPILSADVTISGTVSFEICASESSMTANAGVGVALYRVDEQGIFTLIIRSVNTVELGTSIAKNSWTGSPTSTLVKKGHRLAAVILMDDVGTMGSGFTLSAKVSSTLADVGDSNLTLTENLSFLSADPSGSSYYLRDSASDISSGKALLTTQGSGTVDAVHTTIAGPLTFPGDQWTATAGGSDIEWFTPQLSAFTLSGVIKAEIGGTGTLSQGLATPFDAIVLEVARVNSDGSGATIFARCYQYITGSPTYPITLYLSGPDLAISDGQRLRLRVFSEDVDSANNQVSGTNRTMRYDGTSTYASRLIFTQSITELSLTKGPPLPRNDRRIIPLI